MAQRRFGPTRGAGVAIVEEEGSKTIEPAALGFAGYGAMFEKGKVGELIIVTSRSQFIKKMGSYIPESFGPDCAFDYFEAANGAGGLCLVRVTDGDELQASATLYARKGSLLTPMGSLKSANGGRWGGKAQVRVGEVSASSDITATTLTTGVTMKKDELAGGFLELAAVSNKRYTIVGNTTGGVITVVGDATMLVDWTAAAAPSNLTWYASLENAGKAVSYRITDGEELPDTEFGIEVYVDGNFIKKYANLSTDPTSARYWVNVINNDDGNDEIFATDLWTGGHDATVRPANHYGKIASVTATILTATVHDFTINSPGGGDPTCVLGTTNDTHLAQKLTITMSSATAGAVVSDKLGALGTITLGTAFDAPAATGGADLNKFVPPFTITAGSNPLAASNILVINYKPFKPSALVGGRLFPDKVNAKREAYRIVSNTHKTITVADGSDLTVSGASADDFLVEAALELAGGRDGHASVVDATYAQKAWDTAASPFNRIFGKNLGLVKFATPGVTSTAVIQAGKAYADAKNHQYRYEVAADVVTEDAVIGLVNDTLGRSDYGVLAFPSWGYVPDPLGGNEGKLKLVPLTGMIHGREARIAADYTGYHKAGAGQDAILAKVLKLPTGDAQLNEELLNPVGVAVIKKLKGNFVIWGDRTLNLDPDWKWKHQRELMSYYEHVLQENFDWIVFAINDPDTEKLALAAMQNYFQPEWVKRALRGKTFQEAAIIKIDAELNTDATRAAGDMVAEIKLKLADTVERFIIRVGKQGVFEQVA